MGNRLTLPNSIALLLILTGALFAQGRFVRIGLDLVPTDISGDGRIVVGTYPEGQGVWRWTESEGLQRIGGDGVSTLPKISRDGRTIVSCAADSTGLISAAIWQGGRNWWTLGGVPGGVPGGANNKELSNALGVSADGSVIVGLAWVENSRSRAFRWTRETGMVDLGSRRGGSSKANTVSADGRVAVGWDSSSESYTLPPRPGAIWMDGSERLLHPFGWTGEILATNASGTVLVGKGNPNDTEAYSAYRWLAGEGNLEDLGALLQRPSSDGGPTLQSAATAVSDDGSIIGGGSGTQPTLAFIWTPSTKIMPLTEYLQMKGITGWERYARLMTIQAMTPDGKVMIGTALNQQLQFEGFLIEFR